MLAVIEHATRRIRILGATPHPTASWVAQAAKNLVMDLQDAGSRARFLIRDRDGKFPGLFNTVLNDAGIETVLSGVQMPRMKPRVAYCTSSGRCGVFCCCSGGDSNGRVRHFRRVTRCLGVRHICRGPGIWLVSAVA